MLEVHHCLHDLVFNTTARPYLCDERKPRLCIPVQKLHINPLMSQRQTF